MGDDVRVTVIAAGFDRWDDNPRSSTAVSSGSMSDPGEPTGEVPIADVFAGGDDDDLDIGDDDFDVPSFLK